MDFTLDYGQDQLSGSIPWGRCLGVLDIADTPPLADPVEALRAGLAGPIGMNGHALDAFHADETVAIVVSDSFRYTAIELLLPLLLSELNARGIGDESIRFVFATGTHRGPTDEEAAQILGAEVHARFGDRAFSHDAHAQDDLVQVGETTRGTVVELSRHVMECDRVIATGSVVLHYFGGFGGGRKSILPGVASARSIANNHALNLDPAEDRLNPDVRIGGLAGNPVAEDMLEGARMCPVDCIVNTVLNRHGQIAGLFVGDMEAAHGRACAFAEDLYTVPIAEQADFVIATGGKAKNFIQSHKALFNAYQAMKPDGRMLFAARAAEGFGGNKIARWLALGTRDAVIAELRRAAEINGQTALSTLEKAPSAVMVTELNDDEVALLGACKAIDLEDALAQCRCVLQKSGLTNPTYYVMPSAPYTVPILGR